MNDGNEHANKSTKQNCRQMPAPGSSRPSSSGGLVDHLTTTVQRRIARSLASLPRSQAAAPAYSLRLLADVEQCVLRALARHDVRADAAWETALRRALASFSARPLADAGAACVAAVRALVADELLLFGDVGT
jgi:hypothetical protein